MVAKKHNKGNIPNGGKETQQGQIYTSMGNIHNDGKETQGNKGNDTQRWEQGTTRSKIHNGGNETIEREISWEKKAR